MSLPDAIKQLQYDLETRAFSETLLSEIAADFNVHPELLRRKFTEQFGVIPDQYKPPKPKGFSQEYLLNKAREFWRESRFRGEPDKNPLFGKEFSTEDQQAIVIAFSGKQLYYIDKKTARSWVYTWPSRKAAVHGLTDFGLVGKRHGK